MHLIVSIYCLEKRSWTKVKQIIPPLKSDETQAAHKKGSFIEIHWLVQNATQRKRLDINSRRCPHEGRVYKAIVRAQLNCLKGGLTQSIKLSEIVRKFPKPYGFQTFQSFLCGGTHLSQYCCLRGTGPYPLWAFPSGNAAYLSLLFMLYAQNYGRVTETKRSIKAGKKLAQTLWFL